VTYRAAVNVTRDTAVSRAWPQQTHRIQSCNVLRAVETVRFTVEGIPGAPQVRRADTDARHDMPLLAVELLSSSRIVGRPLRVVGRRRWLRQTGQLGDEMLIVRPQELNRLRRESCPPRASPVVTPQRRELLVCRGGPPSFTTMRAIVTVRGIKQLTTWQSPCIIFFHLMRNVGWCMLLRSRPSRHSEGSAIGRFLIRHVDVLQPRGVAAERRRTSWLWGCPLMANA
jgi:hypothetical protein